MAERHSSVLHGFHSQHCQNHIFNRKKKKKKEERLGRWLMGQDTCHHLTTAALAEAFLDYRMEGSYCEARPTQV